MGVLSSIFAHVEALKSAPSDYVLFIAKFEETLYPLLEIVYQMDHQQARKCFQKGEAFETIEEYLMVILSMLVVKGFGDLSRDLPEVAHLEFDIKVDEDDSENLERCLETYPYDLKDALMEKIRIRDFRAESQFPETEADSTRPRSTVGDREEDFPDFEEKASGHSREEDDGSPGFNNLYYHQNTKEFESKDTFSRTNSNINKVSGIQKSKIGNEQEKNTQIFKKIQKVLSSKESDSGQSKWTK